MFWPFQISSREAAAVEQWLATNKTFHVMRDHPQHDTTILGGMWGARWDQLPAPRAAEELARLRQRMLERGQGKSRHGVDQEILSVRGAQICLQDISTRTHTHTLLPTTILRH